MNNGQDILPVIGISPGNPYFSQNAYTNVDFVIEETRRVFAGNRPIVIMVPDVPDRANWQALGAVDPIKESKNAARSLKNHIRKYCQDHKYSEAEIKILDWENEIGDLRVKDDAASVNLKFRKECKAAYQGLLNLGDLSPTFRNAIRKITSDVLVSKCRQHLPRGHIKNILADDADFQTRVSDASAYILSEFAFLEAAPRLFGKTRATYVYHKAWAPYEQYMAGCFDGTTRRSLDYHVIEAESETYKNTDGGKIIAPQSAPAIRPEQKLLRVAFSDYAPGIFYDAERGEMRGIFHDLLQEIARRRGYRLQITEEVGYGAAVTGLRRGRFDIFCSPTWETPERAAETALTDSVFSSDVGVFVRRDHPVLRTGIDSLNDDAYVIDIKQDDITDMYVQQRFRAARTVNTPQLEPIRELLARVLDGRSAAAIVDPVLANLYMQQRGLGDQLVNAASIDTVANHFMFPKSREEQIMEFNAEIKKLGREGFIAALVEKYTGHKNSYNYPPGLSPQPHEPSAKFNI